MKDDLYEITVNHCPEQVGKLEPGKWYKRFCVTERGDHVCDSIFLVLGVQEKEKTKKAIINEILGYEDFVREVDFTELGLAPEEGNICGKGAYLVPADSTSAKVGESLDGFQAYVDRTRKKFWTEININY